VHTVITAYNELSYFGVKR